MTLRDEIYGEVKGFAINSFFKHNVSCGGYTDAILAIFKARLDEIKELALGVNENNFNWSRKKFEALCTLDESEPTRTSGIGVAEDDEPIFNAYEYVKLMQKMFPHEKPSEMRKKIEKAFEEYGESADDEKLRDKIRGELNMLSSQVYSLDNCSVIGGLNTVVEPCVDHIMAAIKEARDG
jgi:hypothetical protein